MSRVGSDIRFTEIEEDVKIIKKEVTKISAPLGHTVCSHSQGYTLYRCLGVLTFT